MGKIIDIRKNQLEPIENKNLKKVLVGGCFDIPHAGHIEFLKKAKKEGDILLVLLESDETVKKLKGNNRPINDQNMRASVLANISSVDYVIMLPPFKNDDDYRILVKQIEPGIIAVTEKTKLFDWELEYMNKTGGKVKIIMKKKPGYSTSILAQRIKI